MNSQMDAEQYDRFMGEALAEARVALAAGEFPVGCVVAAQGRVIAKGGRAGSRGKLPNELDHAEIIALRRLQARWGSSPPEGAALFCTMEPCLMCFGAILLAGIRKIIYAYEDVMGGGTTIDPATLSPLYRDKELAIVRGVRREESLALFREFFSNPKNAYWQKSLLAEYTLGQ